MGGPFGLKDLSKKFEQGDQVFIKSSARINKIKDVLDKLIVGNADYNTFITELRNNKLDVSINKDEKGAISAVTIIDYKDKMIFDSSRLGEDYSPRTFDLLFDGKPLSQEIASVSDTIALDNIRAMTLNSSISHYQRQEEHGETIAMFGYDLKDFQSHSKKPELHLKGLYVNTDSSSKQDNLITIKKKKKRKKGRNI